MSLTEEEKKEFSTDAKYLQSCLNLVKTHTERMVPILNSLHTEMSSFQNELKNLCEKNEGDSKLHNNIVDSLQKFVDIEQLLSEVFYDIISQTKIVNQSVKEIENTYVTPLIDTFNSEQSSWDIFSWFIKKPKNTTNSVNIMLTLLNGSWQFKLQLGELMESMYRAFNDGSTNINGTDLNNIMTRTRLEVSDYELKYNNFKQGYKGKSLNEILTIEQREGKIPLAIEKIIFKLKDKGYLEEGIFRKSPNKVMLDKTYEGLGAIDFDYFDFILLGEVLKKFFRELPSMVFNVNLRNKIIQMINDKSVSNEQIQNVLSKHLSRNEFVLVRELFGLLSIVENYKSKNKMTSDNLARMWVPCLFPLDVDNQMEFINQLDKLKEFVKILIENCFDIFNDFKDRKSIRVSNTRKSLRLRCKYEDK